MHLSVKLRDQKMSTNFLLEVHGTDQDYHTSSKEQNHPCLRYKVIVVIYHQFIKTLHRFSDLLNKISIVTYWTLEVLCQSLTRINSQFSKRLVHFFLRTIKCHDFQVFACYQKFTQPLKMQNLRTILVSVTFLCVTHHHSKLQMDYDPIIYSSRDIWMALLWQLSPHQ